MKYYKTAWGRFSEALTGERDPSDPGMNREEYLEWQKKGLSHCLAPFRVDKIIKLVYENPNSCESKVTEDDLSFCYREGTEEQIKLLSQYIDAE